MLTNDLVPCFIQSFSMDSKTGYEKALLVGLFDRTFTCLAHRISASAQAAGSSCEETGGCRRSTRGRS